MLRILALTAPMTLRIPQTVQFAVQSETN